MNADEHREREHLAEIRTRLQRAIDHLDGRVRGYAAQVKEEKAYLWDHRGEMDHVEKAAARQATQHTVFTAETTAAARYRLKKLELSPYFGRVDFRREEESEARPLYIGTNSFVDDETREHLVYDWRAPVSTIFYDYELGAARYHAPGGEVQGEITRKRQYRIRDGEMELMIESGLHIVDDVLQDELSRASDDKMKNIVATIQRDQNAIIRNENAPVLVIQGAAGSGKTSIALHRVAFLLYRFKETVSAKDVLIVSPNKVFASFISNVLPELGEEPIAELEMQALAARLLDDKRQFETPFEQATRLLDKKSEPLRRRVEAKSSHEFLEQLRAYVKHVRNTRFQPEHIELARFVIPAPIPRRLFERRKGLPMTEHVQWIVESIEHELWSNERIEINSKERATIRARVRRMFRKTTTRRLYEELFEWLGEPSWLKAAPRSRIEWADVFPMIYLQIEIEGRPEDYDEVRHLLIDEMQDYTPVQYAVMAKLFPCNKTILGDASQAIHSSVASTAEGVGRVFPEAEIVRLSKSYRSSYEITMFALEVLPSAELVAIERHGEPPRVVACATPAAELRFVEEAISAFEKERASTMGIICKAQPQAERLHAALEARGIAARLLGSESASFVPGVVVCSVHMSKGLEFDHVVVPHASAEHYASDLDRNLLYVACTRAMHRLALSHVGAPSPLLPSEDRAAAAQPAHGSSSAA